MALAVVQHNLAIHGNSVPGSVTIGSTPTVGNLLIAFVGCNIGPGTFTIGSGWTQFDQVNDFFGGDTAMTAMYRYVQAGDTATLPAFWSAGTTYWTHDVYEISGVSGTWTSDFLASVPLNDATVSGLSNGLANAPLPTFPIPSAGIALTSAAFYNASVNWTISGSWTLDDAANNSGNYGAAAGASRVVSSGNTIDGAWSTTSGGGPAASMMVLLTTSQPTGGVYPRHVYRTQGSGTFPGSITVPWAPKVGSLLLAYICWADGTQLNPTVNTSSWTDWADATIVTKSMLALYRYVQPGDTAALPALCTAGSSPYAVSIVELTGGSGTFGTDHVSDKVGAQATGSSLTTTADTTTANNQFAVLAYGNYDGNALLAFPTGFSGCLQSSSNLANYGSWLVAFKFFPASGSAVQGTITPYTTIHSQSYVQSIFNQGTGSISDSVNLTGVAETMAAAGATPSPSDALSGASMAGAAAAVKPSISVTPAAASMSGAAAGVSAGGGPGLAIASMTGAAEPLAPLVAVNLHGVGMACAAAGVIQQAGANLGGVSFSGAAEPLAIAIAIPLAPAIFEPDAAPIIFGYPVAFPVFRIMSDTPIGVVGPMHPGPIALIAQMPPYGPTPGSIEVLLQGVGMTCKAATITPFFNVYVNLAPASMTCAAAPVIAA